MESTAKVLFVINKKSGLQEIVFAEAEVEKHASTHAYSYELYFISSRDAKAEIAELISIFNPTIVCAAGGDGTVNLVASLIQSKPISMLIIPSGSANGMAKELQIPFSFLACLDLINNGVIKQIDLLKVNDQISVHLADVGINARIVERFEMDKKRGLLTYAKHLFYEIFILKRNRFKVTCDGKFMRVKAISMTFANATKYGTSAVINPDGILNDGLFEICIVKPFPKYHVIGIAYKMFRNTLKYSEFFQVLRCKKAQINCSRKTILQNDGELMGRVSQIRLEILPKALQVILSSTLLHPTIID